jgi:RNA recognition motif-containing protein
MTFHVGNLSRETTREEVLEAFRAHGAIASVTLPAEGLKGGRASGVHRGYAFVVMHDRIEGTEALRALDGRALHGQAMSVRVAIPRKTPHYVH